jgi:hypothetical protein
MLKLRQVLRYFTEGTSKKQITKEEEKELIPLKAILLGSYHYTLLMRILHYSVTMS